jgi:hypothetical protein
VLRRIFGPKRKEVTGELMGDGRIILKWICKKWDGEIWTGLI